MKRYTVTWGRRKVYSCQTLKALSAYLLTQAKMVEVGGKVCMNVYASHTDSNHGVTLQNKPHAYGWYTGVAYAIPYDKHPNLGGRSAMTHYHDSNNCPI